MALFLTGVSFVLGSCGQQASEITPAIGPETHRQFLNMIGESFATNWPIGGIQDPTNVSGGEIRALGMHLTRESMNPKQFGKEYNDLIMP
ncbi:MAG: hypothetical protein JXC85_00400 [Candidatus Aenigmarchaeota archaeon]|nr:hypothetical protein [Candidatus Aenigmarchaeota archaeon]